VCVCVCVCVCTRFAGNDIGGPGKHSVFFVRPLSVPRECRREKKSFVRLFSNVHHTMYTHIIIIILLLLLFSSLRCHFSPASCHFCFHFSPSDRWIWSIGTDAKWKLQRSLRSFD
jgi:hypothetical protein